MEERGQYQVGEFVIPIDLPRVFVCYVTNAYPIGQEDDQLLELQPLDGPWPVGTLLIRMDHMVRTASPVEVGLAQAGSRHHSGASVRRGRQPNVDVWVSMAIDDGLGRPTPKVA